MGRRLRTLENAVTALTKVATDAAGGLLAHEKVCVERMNSITKDMTSVKRAITFANALLITTLIGAVAFFLKRQYGG